MEAINDTILQEITQPVKSRLLPFDENFRLLRNVKEDIPGVLQIAFTWSAFDDYLLTLWKWLQAAIGNDKSAYENGHRRVDLLKFYDSIIPLLEVLNAIHETNKIVKLTGNQQQKSLAESNLSVTPKVVIQEFCRSYTWEYCRMEIWDWLDGAITSDDFYKVGLERSFLLIEYQCIHSLIEAAYLLDSENEEKILCNSKEETKRGTNDIVSIKYFFLNNPLEQAKAMMQEFYSAWVHHTAEVAAAKEHSEKLMFHDYVVQLFDELHDIVKEPVEDEKAQTKI